jgi:hypothetical protein
MPELLQEYVAQLKDPQAAELRKATCSILAEALATTGAVLWAFGAADQPRRAIAVAIQMGGETGHGAILLLRNDNRYAAAALVRQLIEIEYLLCLFTVDTDEPFKWALSDPEKLRKEYMPGRMRDRSGNQFRADEYWTHCGIGGHPRFAAAYLLPEHMLLDDPAIIAKLGIAPLSNAIIFAAAWVDLAQHLVRIWRWVGEILKKYDLLDVGLAKLSLVQACESIELWLAGDKCAPLFSESEALMFAQLPREPSDAH